MDWSSGFRIIALSFSAGLMSTIVYIKREREQNQTNDNVNVSYAYWATCSDVFKLLSNCYK